MLQCSQQLVSVPQSYLHVSSANMEQNIVTRHGDPQTVAAQQQTGVCVPRSIEPVVAVEPTLLLPEVSNAYQSQGLPFRTQAKSCELNAVR